MQPFKQRITLCHSIPENRKKKINDDLNRKMHTSKMTKTAASALNKNLIKNCFFKKQIIKKKLHEMSFKQKLGLFGRER